VLGRQMKYYTCERRHSRLDCRSPIGCLISEGFIPERLAENGIKSGSAPGAQVQVVLEIVGSVFRTFDRTHGLYPSGLL